MSSFPNVILHTLKISLLCGIAFTAADKTMAVKVSDAIKDWENLPLRTAR